MSPTAKRMLTDDTTPEHQPDLDEHHTCVYVSTEDGDRCVRCGATIADEWAFWNWRDRENGFDVDWDGREYDYEGGGSGE